MLKTHTVYNHFIECPISYAIESGNDILAPQTVYTTFQMLGDCVPSNCCCQQSQKPQKKLLDFDKLDSFICDMFNISFI